MDIKITDEQIKEIAEKQIMNIVKPKVNSIFSARDYYTKTNIEVMIENAIHIIIENKVEEFLKDNKISELVKKEDIAKGLGYAILNVITIKGACNNLDDYEDDNS